MSEIVKFEFDILSEDYLNAGSVSSEIKKYLNQIGINHKLIRRIAISSYEAEINIIIHSLGGKLILEISDHEINLFSKDIGPGIKNIEQAMTPGYSTANDKARELGFGAGMGLPNMKKNADVFLIDSSPNGTNIGLKYFV
jgi:anti-sigma regulatory factor (Ser/Thr protein kinase)